MKFLLHIVIFSILVIYLPSCAPGARTLEFYGKVGSFSNEQGSHGELLALLKTTEGQTTKAAATGKRGIAIKPSGRSSAAVTKSAQTKEYSQNYAVVIGVDDYKYWPKLDNARNDAYAMEQILKGLGFVVYRLYDRQATRDKIQSTITDIMGTKAGPNDRVLIFYAGHGHTLELEGGGNLGYIVPVDSKTDEYGTMISMTNLLDWSRIIRARQLLFIMDACYSGTGKLSEFTLKSSPGDNTCKTRQIITAGEKDQQVFDSTEGGVRHSVFTNYLIRALRESSADLDGDGLTSATELGEYLKQNVSSDTGNQQTPDYGQLPGHNCSDYVFYPQDPEAAEEGVYAYCDISPEYISLESFTKFNITGKVNDILFNPVFNDVVAVSSNNKLIVRNLDQDKEILVLNRSIKGITFSPNGRSLAVVDSYGKLTFYDASDGREVYSIKSPISKVNSLAFSPKSGRLALGGNGKVVVWDIKANILKPMAMNHTGTVHSLYFVDKKSLFSVSDKMTSKLWNLNNQQEMKRLDESSDMQRLFTAAFSDDGSLMALGLKRIDIDLQRGRRDDFEYIRLRNTDTGDDLWTFEGHDKSVTTLSFHPSKNFFASGSDDKTIKFWDVRDRKEFKVIPNASVVDEVSFSPNGCFFAAASGGTVSVWKLTEDRGI